MNTALLLTVLAASVLQALSCSPDESSGPHDRTYQGTVETLCKPHHKGNPKAETCSLSVQHGCDLCALRAYSAEKVTTDFLARPLSEDGLSEQPYGLATRCRCAEGCYFHRGSAVAIGKAGLPAAADGSLHPFSEPFVCFSGISAPQTKRQSHVYLKWCGTPDGCPHNLVARFLFLARHHLLPERAAPAVGSARLPSSLCRRELFDKKVRGFLAKPRASPSPSPSSPPKNKGKDRSKLDMPFKLNAKACRRSSRVERCVERCLSK